MTKKDIIDYWLVAASRDLETAEILFKSKKYNYCLFFCHLAIEKLLKGLVYKKRNSPPDFTHNLVNLAKQAKIKLTKIFESDIKEITTWNMTARYDTVKFDFYKKATIPFTKTWFAKAKEIYQWLKNQY